MRANTSHLTGNLHFKPLSCHLTRFVVFGVTSAHQIRKENNWQGHTVDLISKASLFIGACFIIPLALVETVTTLSIAMISLAANYFLFCNKIVFLQKHSLKFLSFAIHSAVTTVANFILAFRLPQLRYHTANALVDNGVYLGTAAFTQLIVGSIIDQSCGRSLDFAKRRTFSLLRDSHPNLLQDLASQMERDFGIHLVNRLGSIPPLDEHLARHPEDREFITNFEFEQLRDRNYQIEAFVILMKFFSDAGLIRPDAVAQEEMRVELSQVSPIEKQYQDTLCDLIQKSIVEVHRTPDLSQYLDEANASGRDRIEMFDAAVVQPLLTYAQYKEILDIQLQGHIQCPEHFTTNELLPYNRRKEKLELVHGQVEGFSIEEKRQLCQKILKGADFELEGALQETFLKIRELASDLERGPLMRKSYIDIEHAQDGDLITNELLYQNAWQEALREIVRRAEIAEEA